MKQYRIVRIYECDANYFEEVRRDLVRHDGINRPLAEAVRHVVTRTREYEEGQTQQVEQEEYYDPELDREPLKEA